jgi:hypothetical protein
MEKLCVLAVVMTFSNLEDDRVWHFPRGKIEGTTAWPGKSAKHHRKPGRQPKATNKQRPVASCVLSHC